MPPTALNTPVLVLNKNWTAIRVIRAKRSIIITSRERGLIIDPLTYNLIKWKEWITIEPSGDELVVISSRGPIKVPEVIILTIYGKVPEGRPRLTKKAIFIRDGFKCQYTGKKLTLESGDIDHVIPRSKNGKNNWDNLVACEKTLNRKKGNRTPHEAGLKLLKKPKQPRYKDLLIDPRIKIPESWRKFL